MIDRLAPVVLALGLIVTVVGCGGSSDPNEEVVGDDLSAAVSSARLPSGHYVNVTSDQDINGIYWVEDVHIAANGTFTGVMGCGLSDCSGHQFPVTAGHWIFHKKGTQIDFSYHYADGRLFADNHYDFRVGKNGAVELRSQDEDGAGWFTLEKQ